MTATLWRVVFALDLVLLLLLAISVPSQEPGSPSRALTYLSLIVISITMISVVVAVRLDWDPFGRSR